MTILFVYDDHLKCEVLKNLAVNPQDHVLLFSLTSKTAVNSTVDKEIRMLAQSVSTIPTALIINQTAERLRDAYLNFITELPDRIKYDGKNLREFMAIDEKASMWWLTLVAEKNTFKTDSFNQWVQLEAIIDYARKEKIEAIAWGCSKPKIQKALKAFASSNLIVFHTLVSGPQSKEKLKNKQSFFYLKNLVLLFGIAVKYFLRVWKIKSKMKGAARVLNDPSQIMFVNGYPNIDLALAQKGVFRNKMFDQLQGALEERHQKMLWIALYMKNEFLSFEETLRLSRRFADNGVDLFFLDEFCTLGNQLKAFWIMLKQGVRFLKIEKQIESAHVLNGYNFYPILKDDWYSSCAGMEGYLNILYYEMFKNLLKEIKAPKCVYCLEMQAWEKSLIWARDKTGNPVSLMGYQHSTVSNMLLNHFYRPKEIMPDKPYALPWPDQIICNGPMTLEYMLQSGWPQRMVTMAEAIRYPHLQDIHTEVLQQRKNGILMVCSINAHESSSVLNIVYEAFKNEPAVKVNIKPHPFVDVGHMFELSSVAADQCPFSMVADPIEHLLKHNKIVVVGESTVAFEALSYGCHVIIVNVPEWINMSSLRTYKADFLHIVNSPQELRLKALEILSSGDARPADAGQIRNIIEHFFCLNRGSHQPERFLKILDHAPVV